MFLRPELNGTYGDPAPRLTVLKEALAAIKRRRGLIHGKFENGGVCSMAALHYYLVKDGKRLLNVDRKVVEEIQGKNDSFPKATTAERRKKVIRWLEAEIKKASQ